MIILQGENKAIPYAYGQKYAYGTEQRKEKLRAQNYLSAWIWKYVAGIMVLSVHHNNQNPFNL